MEALARLQLVQTTLRILREHSILTSEIDGLSSDRFLADFFLFLTETCADVEGLKRRCDTLLKLLPKVSITFLEAIVAQKGTLGVLERRSQQVIVPNIVCDQRFAECGSVMSITDNCNSSSKEPEWYDEKHSARRPTTENINGAKLWTNINSSCYILEKPGQTPELVPLVGLRAMERANTTLEDFCRSYFMFHALDVHNPQHLFKYLPVLSFVEAFIYQLDEENEELMHLPDKGLADRMSSSSKYCTSGSPSVTGLGYQPFRGLQLILVSRGLLTERIESELRNGLEYWKLEQALCESTLKDEKINAEAVLRAIKLKSFDYRVLNLVLYSLTGREVNETHLAFLAVSELLVEISDDLFDYEEDVLKNSFNVLRMLVKVHGPRKAPRLLAKLISEEEMRYDQLLKGLEPNLARHYQERCQEATNEGGGGSKHQWGSWTIPPVISNEIQFRVQAQTKPLKTVHPTQG